MTAVQEWRPDFGRGKTSRVAMMQLASSSVAVLVRPCALGWRLPAPVHELLWCVLTDHHIWKVFRIRCRPAGMLLSAYPSKSPCTGQVVNCEQTPPGEVSRSHLLSFCSDPAVVLVGFGWDSADERKMRRTFGPAGGRASFGAFCDLQVSILFGRKTLI